MSARDTASVSLRGNALAYLESHHVLTLATEGPEGPWAAAVFYVTDGFTLYYLSSPKSRHAMNTSARPRVAATIQEDYDDWTAIRGIQLEGEVRRLEGAQQAAAIERYGNRFPIVKDPAQSEIQAALSRVAWFRLRPDRLYFIDNSQGLGHRDEIPLVGTETRP